MWWIRASIQEFILRSWSLVKMGTTAAQKKLFFNLRREKARIAAFEDGDLTPDQVTEIATRLGVNEDEVVTMNRHMHIERTSVAWGKSVAAREARVGARNRKKK